MKQLWMTVAISMATSIVHAAETGAPEYVGDAAQGQAKSAACAACHGQDGNSAVAEYPKLAGQHASYLASTLKEYRDGVRVNAIMQGMAAGLSDEDIADLAAYYAEQETTPGATDPELVARGEALYRFGDQTKGISACTACHGPTGQGVGSAVFPALNAQWAGYTETQLKLFREGTRENVMMNGVAKNMSDQDIAAVASYVEGLR
jgi:cytochrome c553